MILPALAVGSSVVPAAYGVHRVARWPSGGQALWVWLLFSALANLAVMIMAVQSKPNEKLALSIIPVLAILGLEALGRLSSSERLLVSYRFGALGYVLIWVGCMLYLEDGNGFSSYADPALCLVMTLAAAGLIVARVRVGVPLIFRDPAMLAALATLILYTPFTILGPVASAQFKAHPQFFVAMFEFRAFCQALGSLIFLLALRWTPQEPS